MDYRDDSKHYEIFSKRFTEMAHNILSGEEEEGTPDDLLALGDCYIELMESVRSPIEQMLGAALLFAIDGYNKIRFLTAHDSLTEEETRTMRSGFGTVFYPQANIESFRVDFFFVTFCQGHAAFSVVECDGPDFHEKTKEQVSKDKARDRVITTAGASILRFSGSDIHRRLGSVFKGLVSSVDGTTTRTD